LIWRNCSEGTAYRNLVSCLKELASTVPPLKLQSIITRLCQTPLNKIRSDEIELLQSLCFDNASDKEEGPIVRLNQKLVLDFYWQFLTERHADE